MPIYSLTAERLERLKKQIAAKKKEHDDLEKLDEKDLWSRDLDEFLEEWAKVSKMVVIAREVAQMSKLRSWTDVQLLSFDLQKVEFAYSKVRIIY